MPLFGISKSTKKVWSSPARSLLLNPIFFLTSYSILCSRCALTGGCFINPAAKFLPPLKSRIVNATSLTPRWVPFVIASRFHLVERSWLFWPSGLKVMMPALCQSTFLARKKKKDEKVRIIFDRRRAMKRRSFPYDHHRQEERTIWWSVLKRFWPHFFLLSLSA